MKKLLLITTLASTLLASNVFAVGNISDGFGNNSGQHDGINYLEDNTKVTVATGVTTSVNVSTNLNFSLFPIRIPFFSFW